MNTKPSILEINKNASYREIILDTLCQGIKNTSEFRDLLEYVIDKKLYLFEGFEFQGNLYDGDDDILDLIMPSIRRVWGKVYITPPSMLREKRLELFELLFDIDDFLDYLVLILPKSANKLEIFGNLDRTQETLQLIVDNYIAGLFHKSYNSETVDADLKAATRDKNLKRIIND
jgi:hypothetical protein